MPVTFQQVYF